MKVTLKHTACILAASLGALASAAKADVYTLDITGHVSSLSLDYAWDGAFLGDTVTAKLVLDTATASYANGVTSNFDGDVSVSQYWADSRGSLKATYGLSNTVMESANPTTSIQYTNQTFFGWPTLIMSSCPDAGASTCISDKVGAKVNLLFTPVGAQGSLGDSSSIQAVAKAAGDSNVLYSGSIVLTQASGPMPTSGTYYTRSSLFSDAVINRVENDALVASFMESDVQNPAYKAYASFKQSGGTATDLYFLTADIDSVKVSVGPSPAVPEPSAMALVGVGIVVVGAVRRKSGKAAETA